MICRYCSEPVTPGTACSACGYFARPREGQPMEALERPPVLSEEEREFRRYWLRAARAGSPLAETFVALKWKCVVMG